jgi:hypothetical protein
MNSDETADDDEAPRRVRFIRARASETFDGQDRVLSRVAYDLQVRVTAHSASCGHPGFVSDDYLEHLDGLSVHTPDVMSHRAQFSTQRSCAAESRRCISWSRQPSRVASQSMPGASQADSAGSIPVTRSKRERAASALVSERSSGALMMPHHCLVPVACPIEGVRLRLAC